MLIIFSFIYKQNKKKTFNRYTLSSRNQNINNDGDVRYCKMDRSPSKESESKKAASTVAGGPRSRKRTSTSDEHSVKQEKVKTNNPSSSKKHKSFKKTKEDLQSREVKKESLDDTLSNSHTQLHPPNKEHDEVEKLKDTSKLKSKKRQASEPTPPPEPDTNSKKKPVDVIESKSSKSKNTSHKSIDQILYKDLLQMFQSSSQDKFDFKSSFTKGMLVLTFYFERERETN